MMKTKWIIRICCQPRIFNNFWKDHFQKIKYFEPALLFLNQRVCVTLSHNVIMKKKNIAKHLKQVIPCFLYKQFFFSKHLTGESSKSEQLRKETFQVYKLKYCIYQASLYKEQQRIRTQQNFLKNTCNVVTMQ